MPKSLDGAWMKTSLIDVRNGILLYRSLWEETEYRFLVSFFSLLSLQEPEFDLRDTERVEQVIPPQLASINKKSEARKG